MRALPLLITQNIGKNKKATAKLKLNRHQAGAASMASEDGKKTADVQQADIPAGTKNGVNL